MIFLKISVNYNFMRASMSDPGILPKFVINLTEMIFFSIERLRQFYEKSDVSKRCYENEQLLIIRIESILLFTKRHFTYVIKLLPCL